MFLFALWLIFGFFVVFMTGVNRYGEEIMERVDLGYIAYEIPTGRYFGLEIFLPPIFIFLFLTFFVGWGWLWFKEENKIISTKRKSL